jgi:hypothetical protein
MGYRSTPPLAGMLGRHYLHEIRYDHRMGLSDIAGPQNFGENDETISVSAKVLLGIIVKKGN